MARASISALAFIYHTFNSLDNSQPPQGTYNLRSNKMCQNTSVTELTALLPK